MKDVGATGADMDVSAKREDHLIRLALLAHEALSAAELAVNANVVGVFKMNLLQLGLQNALLDVDKILRD